MTSSYTEIIKLAALSCKPHPSLAELKELDYGLSEIGDAASRLVVMARKLMKGKPFRYLATILNYFVSTARLGRHLVPGSMSLNKTIGRPSCISRLGFHSNDPR